MLKVAQDVEAACARCLRTRCFVSPGFRRNEPFPYAVGLRAAKRSAHKKERDKLPLVLVRYWHTGGGPGKVLRVEYHPLTAIEGLNRANHEKKAKSCT